MAYLKPSAGLAKEGRTVAGAPAAGTDEIQTLTIGGAPTTAGTIKLAYKGQITAAITWSATNNTLRDRVDAALGALSTIGGASNVTTAVGTMTLGVGTLTITFVANLGKLNVPLITVAENGLDGAGTVAIATTTPGVTATHRGAPKGAMVTDTDNGVWYQNTGTVYAPTWTAVDVASVAGELTDLAAAIPTAAVVTVAGLGITIAAANPTAVAAADAAAVAGTTPAGGTGATEGAYDTAANRNLFIATVAEIKASVNVLVTEATELKAKAAVERTELTELKLDIATLSDTAVETKTQLNALLVALRTAGIVTP